MRPLTAGRGTCPVPCAQLEACYRRVGIVPLRALRAFRTEKAFFFRPKKRRKRRGKKWFCWGQTGTQGHVLHLGSGGPAATWAYESHWSPCAPVAVSLGATRRVETISRLFCVCKRCTTSAHASTPHPNLNLKPQHERGSAKKRPGT